MADCSELAQGIADLAEAVALREDMRNYDDVVAHISGQFPELSRQDITQSILEAHRARMDSMTKAAQSKLSAIKAEALSEGKTRETIAELEKQIESGAFGDRATRQQAREVNSTLAALKQQAAKLNRDSALRQRIEELTQALETDILPEPKRRAETTDDELLRLELQRDKLTQAVRQRREELQPKTIFRKTVINPVNAAQGLVRSIQTSMDISAVLRQGGSISLAHPVRAARAFAPMFRAAASEVGAKRIEKSIEARPNYMLYQKAGLELSDWGGSLGRREEFFANRWASKIPGVKASERAYTTFLNVLRADSFDAMVGSLGRAPTKAEAEVAAKFINVSTGRGDVGRMAQTFRDLSAVFYSPRNLWSRFQYLGGGVKAVGDAATGFKLQPETAQMRKLVAKDYARTAAGFGVVAGLALAAGATIERDPRSSDFLKFKFGNTRVDMGMGLLQPLVFLSRVASDSTKNAKGIVHDIRGPGRPYSGASTWDIIGRFGRTKLAPGLGMAIDLKSGENVNGQKVTPLSVAANLTPLGLSDAVAALREQGLTGGTPLALLSIMGAGVASYNVYDGQKPPTADEIKREQAKADREAQHRRDKAARLSQQWK